MTGSNDVNPFDVGPKEEGPQKKVSKDGKEYHLSATANAKVAPTNEHTVKNVTKQGSLNHNQLSFVTTIHYIYGLNGKFPTRHELMKEFFYNEEELDTYLNDPMVIKAIEERGITFPYKALGIEPPVGTPTSPLSPLQLVVANMMLDLTDTRSDRKKLQDAGITTATYQMWLRDPVFSDYLRNRAENLIGDVQHEAMLSLVDRVRSGDLNAVKYYHALTGRYVEDKGNGGSNTVGDLQQIIIRIIEIITEEVDDQDTAFRISDRLKGLITGNVVAGVLPSPVGDDIVVPEIAKAREMNDNIKGLMEKGLGYE